MIPIEVFQRIATHYFYRHLPEETYLELEALLFPYYLDEDNIPLEDEMVELAINFLGELLNQ